MGAMTRALLVVALAATGCGSGQVEAPVGGVNADAATVTPDARGTEPRDAGAVAAKPDAAAEDAAVATDATSAGDAGHAGDPEDAGAPGTVGVFVAQGSVGRTTVSCDDGRTWIRNRSYDLEGSPENCDAVAPVRCFEDAPCTFRASNQQMCTTRDRCDCDHHPGADIGLTFGRGRFVATWGWGPRGALKTSDDGSSWAVALSETTFAGVAFGDGTFIANGRRPQVSTDGLTWTEGGAISFENEAGERIHNARSIGFADAAGGVFVSSASSGNGADLMVSVDRGATWTRPVGSWDCGGRFNGVAGGNGVILVVFRDKACRSDDGGASFSRVDEATASAVVFDGSRFLLWTDTERKTSEDGLTWITDELVVQGLPDGASFDLGPVAYSPDSGTFVSVRTGWKRWYEDQHFYRSEDGVTWEVLPPSNYVQSHRIRHLAYGQVDADICRSAP